jgi:hypothetical protein
VREPLRVPFESVLILFEVQAERSGLSD